MLGTQCEWGGVASPMVHAFMPWDTLHMRAMRSDDSRLEGAFVPDRYIAPVLPLGLTGADLFVLAIFA